MKHKFFSLLLISVLLIIISPEIAKGQPFKVGDKDLNFSIGLGTPWILFNNNVRTQLPFITASLDLGLRDDLGPGVLSIGGIVGATTYENKIYDYVWLHDYGWKGTSLIGALRSTYHYKFIDALDTYGGIHLGLQFESWKEFGEIPNNYTEVYDTALRPVINLFAGAKYHFSDNLFVLGELDLGYRFSLINVGLGLKL